jgi:hypothetical protein
MGRTERTEAQRIPKTVYKCNPAGKRDPGRPLKKQKEQFLI